MVSQHDVVAVSADVGNREDPHSDEERFTLWQRLQIPRNQRCEDSGNGSSRIGVVDDREVVVDGRSEPERHNELRIVERDRPVGSVDLQLIVLSTRRQAIKLNVEIARRIERHVAIDRQQTGTRSWTESITVGRHVDVAGDCSSPAKNSAIDADAARDGAVDVQPTGVDCRLPGVVVRRRQRERAGFGLHESTSPGDDAGDVAVRVGQTRRHITGSGINRGRVSDRPVAVRIEIGLKENRSVAGRQSPGRIRRDIVTGLQPNAAADRRERGIHDDIGRGVQNDGPAGNRRRGTRHGDGADRIRHFDVAHRGCGQAGRGVSQRVGRGRNVDVAGRRVIQEDSAS